MMYDGMPSTVWVVAERPFAAAPRYVVFVNKKDALEYYTATLATENGEILVSLPKEAAIVYNPIIE